MFLSGDERPFASEEAGDGVGQGEFDRMKIENLPTFASEPGPEHLELGGFSRAIDSGDGDEFHGSSVAYFPPSDESCLVYWGYVEKTFPRCLLRICFSPANPDGLAVA